MSFIWSRAMGNEHIEPTPIEEEIFNTFLEREQELIGLGYSHDDCTNTALNEALDSCKDNGIDETKFKVLLIFKIFLDYESEYGTEYGLKEAREMCEHLNVAPIEFAKYVIMENIAVYANAGPEYEHRLEDLSDEKYWFGDNGKFESLLEPLNLKVDDVSAKDTQFLRKYLDKALEHVHKDNTTGFNKPLRKSSIEEYEKKIEKNKYSAKKNKRQIDQENIPPDGPSHAPKHKKGH